MNEATNSSRLRLFFLAAICTSLTIAIDAMYAGDTKIGYSMIASSYAFCWALFQAFSLVAVGLSIGLLLSNRFPRTGVRVGFLLMLAVPAITLLDAITFRWLADRFLSTKTFYVLTELHEGLVAHAQWRTVLPIASAIAGFSFIGAVGYGLSRYADRIKPSQRWGIMAKSVMIVTLFISGLLLLVAFLFPTLPPMSNKQVQKQSPFVAFRIIDAASETERDSPLSDIKLSISKDAVDRRRFEQRIAGVRYDETAQPERFFPDVLIVVIESFRPELISSTVMPNLARLADNGMYLQNHFSGANASNRGMFSLVNGLEAIWFDEPVRYSPLMNRFFRQSGYELGFFASHDDWRLFQMDGFLNDNQYEVFQCEPKGWAEVDERTVARTLAFLEDADRNDSPRLALTYLYTTHADYQSDPQDNVFTPVANDSFTIPYSNAEREGVWNRYKNCAHTVDRLIAPLLNSSLDRNRIVMVTGDHGESFLEDGTCCHGTKISRFQNGTPAIIWAPNISPLAMTLPTMHADLLPTLVGLAGIPITIPNVFDGFDLSHRVPPRDRVFMTCDYLTREACLISGVFDAPTMLGLKCEVSLAFAGLHSIQAIDESGGSFESFSKFTRDETAEFLRTKWMEVRFPEQSD